MTARYIYRDAVTGRLITEAEAALRPNETVREAVPSCHWCHWWRYETELSAEWGRCAAAEDDDTRLTAPDGGRLFTREDFHCAEFRPRST